MKYEIKQVVVYGGKYTKDNKEHTWCALSVGLSNDLGCPFQGAGVTIRMWLDEDNANSTASELTKPGVADKLTELSSGNKWAYKVVDIEKVSAITWLANAMNNDASGFGVETIQFPEKRMLVDPDEKPIIGKDGKAIESSTATIWWFDGILGLDKARQTGRETNRWAKPKSNEEQLAERLAALRALIMG